MICCGLVFGLAVQHATSSADRWTVWASDFTTRQDLAGEAWVSLRGDGLEIMLRLPGRDPVLVRLAGDTSKLHGGTGVDGVWPGQLTGSMERTSYYRAFTGGAYRDGGICRRSVVLEGDSAAIWMSRQERGLQCARYCWGTQNEEGLCPN